MSEDRSSREQFEQVLALLSNEQQRFLRQFRECGVVDRAAKSAKIARGCHYNWLANNDQYREAFELCRVNVCDQIERALAKRLIEGWDEPVFFMGAECGKKRKFDNATALRYLERISPKFKPSSEVDISGAQPIQFYLPDNGRNPEEESEP